MSTVNKSQVGIDFDPIYGEPFAAEVTDTTTWPCERAAEQAIETLLEIHNLGFEGLRIKYANLENNENLISQQADLSTPEGHLVNCVMVLAQSGYEFPKAWALALLFDIYLTEGRPIQTARPRDEQIQWSKIVAQK